MILSKRQVAALLKVVGTGERLGRLMVGGGRLMATDGYKLAVVEMDGDGVADRDVGRRDLERWLACARLGSTPMEERILTEGALLALPHRPPEGGLAASVDALVADLCAREAGALPSVAFDPRSYAVLAELVTGRAPARLAAWGAPPLSFGAGATAIVRVLPGPGDLQGVFAFMPTRERSHG
ncbi:MAG: hypothetical protein LBL86_07265 [Coriobacteriales bacterium]|nr:hypothetical protein [Coriobacteriales bacterium]